MTAKGQERRKKRTTTLGTEEKWMLYKNSVLEIAGKSWSYWSLARKEMRQYE